MEAPAVVYQPDNWIEETMSEYMSLNPDGQRAKWHRSDTIVTDTKLDDSISRKNVETPSAFLAEWPNLTGR